MAGISVHQYEIFKIGTNKLKILLILGGTFEYLFWKSEVSNITVWFQFDRK